MKRKRFAFDTVENSAYNTRRYAEIFRIAFNAVLLRIRMGTE